MRYCSGFLIIIGGFQHVLVKLSNTEFRENPLNVTRVSYRVTQCFSHWVSWSPMFPQRRVRGSERRKCVMVDDFY